ncbi:MAG: ATP-dependent DNA helicase RecG [Anaerolineaceae bacterium]|nr:ATP-dependent DNA helicase RecG [Anaerolineaceae bacterium]
MQRSIETLYKIFKLEADFNYSNKAVVGGLEKLTSSWVGEARADGLPEEQIQNVIALLERYPNLDLTARAKTLSEIGEILDNAGIKHLPGADVNKEPVKQSTSSVQKLTPQTNQPARKSRGSVQKRTSGPAPVPDAQSTQGLSAPTTAVRGIGDKQAALLSKLGLNTIEDMVYYFPNRYDDYSELKTIRDLTYGDEVTILAWVKSVKTFQVRKGRKITQAVVSDSTGAIQLMWFNQEYQMRYLRKDMFLAISGKIDQYMGRLVMHHPDYEQVTQEQINTQRIVPVYGLTARLSQRWLRRSMHNVVTYWAPKIPDFLTEYILKDADLMDVSTALMEIHFPENKSNLKNARFRLAFDEIFLLQLGVLRQKYDWANLTGRSFEAPDEWLVARATHLPFELTHAQYQALSDIRKDLASGRPMNRLLQGDVGSGKTVVAAIGVSVVLKNGSQGAFMAPTSILAEQHYTSLKRLLANPEDAEAVLKEDEIRLLIGDTPAGERAEILAGLADGSIKLIVGTHALIEDPVVFNDLQIVIVDEQHRFGVAQRAALREKGQNPHLLVMTATPIPRSLALTVYGDLDISVMDEMPAGRQPISTHIIYPLERERVYSLIRAQVKEGHQAFVIYPLVEQGDNDENMAAVEERERLQEEVFPNLKVGLLHGRMRPDEKEEVMRKFRDMEYQVLVSTSVVEVGVDIPNATVMVVEGANRFGLAQLHQFRGRVGRGSAQSYCLLIPETSDAAENERLQAMESTNDGFILAEKDLNQRGPGEFLGTRQSGYTNLRLANLTDVHLIEKARHYAQQVFENDPNLTAPEHQLMLDALNHFWPSTEGDIS